MKIRVAYLYCVTLKLGVSVRGLEGLLLHKRRTLLLLDDPLQNY